MKTLPDTLKNLVNLLNDGNFHDGNRLGEQLNMSRAGVWKWIKILQAHNIDLSVDKHKGYRLKKPYILLDKRKIQKNLTTLNKKSIALQVFASIDSTNEFFKTYDFNGKHVYAVCVAEEQTQGHGRLQREWFSPFAENIYCSLCYELNQDISQLAGLSLVVSLVIMQTLNQISNSHDFKIKWPNDVLYQNQKIAGNLIEIHAQSHDLAKVIIGIGLNVNMDKCLHIKKPYTSLFTIYQQTFDRNLIIAQLINHLITTLNQFHERGFSAFQKEFEKQNVLQHREVELIHLQQTFVGEVKGVTAQGHIILRLKNGKIKHFTAGDCSLRRF